MKMKPKTQNLIFIFLSWKSWQIKKILFFWIKNIEKNNEMLKLFFFEKFM
jgi:hypothetical protein